MVGSADYVIPLIWSTKLRLNAEERNHKKIENEL